MPFACYVSLEGQKQGKFNGEQSLSKLGADKITALQFSYSVNAPFDQATGQASGRRQHGVVRFTKEMGAATPQIFSALTDNETLKTAVFECTRTSAAGQEEIYARYTLTNARVVSLDWQRDGNARGHPFDGHELNVVGLAFEKIEIEHLPSKTTASDDWEAPSS